MILSLLATLVLSSHAQAVDMGFRYVGGKCVNATGKEGLNPTYLGQCSDLRLITLGGLTFEELDLSGSRFDGAVLDRINLNKTILVGVSFESASVSGAQFMDAKISKANFRGAVLKNVTFAEAIIEMSNFDSSSMTGGTFSYFSCRGCSFRRADFTGSNFESADFQSTDFTGGQFSDANLTKSDLRGAVFKDAIMKKTRLDGADLTSANLANADLRGASLRDAKIEKAVLTGAKFNKKTDLPISQDRAKDLGMVFEKLEVLVEVGGRAFFKIPVEGLKMTDENILAACKKEGVLTPCTHMVNGDYSDALCTDVGLRDGGSPMLSLAHALCGKDKNPAQCPQLENTFQYMGRKFAGGAACGAIKNSWCVVGSGVTGGFAVCAE